MIKKIFIPIAIVIAGSAVFFLILNLQKNPADIKFVPRPQISEDILNKKELPAEISYTDENSGEDLIIHADRDVYNGLSSSLVFFKVTPQK